PWWCYMRDVCFCIVGLGGASCLVFSCSSFCSPPPPQLVYTCCTFRSTASARCSTRFNGTRCCLKSVLRLFFSRHLASTHRTSRPLRAWRCGSFDFCFFD